ncbi:MAG: folylpolyglutamate synthase/dihydrofolate synthase family protein [Candidatus Omnitrophota bacterium]|jgi:dihydrofolate synthase/folylpolyglutamate synthase
MIYSQAIRYLESFVNYEKIPDYPYKGLIRLKRIKDFLKIIDSPQDSLRCIHVAGSKGKGSTCIFIASILRESGYKVGLYTSPHLSDFRERIRILIPRAAFGGLRKKDPFEGKIPKKELLRLVAYLKKRIDNFNKHSKSGPLTFFEIFTVLAFLYFKKNNVDFAVLETGLGGRLDATNVVRPLACVITPISYEHTRLLGKTLTKIAKEKSGIIKRNTSVISAPQNNAPRRFIRQRCSELNAALYEVRKGTAFRVNLLGAHQLMNAAVAQKTVEVLNLGVGIDCVKQGLKNALWPGRCEIAGRSPYIILDGAQNKASAKVIKKAVRDNFNYKKLVLVLGISNDKDIKGICKELSPIADKVVLTKADSIRATAPDTLALQFRNKEKYLTASVKEAKALAKSLARRGDLILVTGSLFVVGEFRHAQG